MASPFGTFGVKPAMSAPAPASPFGFSTATTNTSAAPGFSTPSFTGFGTATSSAPAFGFGQTSAPFGAASTATFGVASSAPGTTGSAPGTTSFGTFGQSQPAASTGGLFGAPAAASSSAFGATTTPFGAGTSLFGASSTPVSGALTLFGQASSASTFSFNLAPGGTTSALGPSQQQQGGLFGATPQVPGLDPATGLTADDALRGILRVANAYNPSSPEFKFQYLFLSVIENPAQRVKPPQVDETRWRQALAQAGGPNNPDRLWPVVANGFKDLLARSQLQVTAISENSQRLKALQEVAARLAARGSGELRERALALQSRHKELTHRLLHVTRCIDALESRLALTVGYHGNQSRAKDAEVSRRLERVEGELAPTAAAGMQRRLEAVAAAARLRGAGIGTRSGSGGLSGVKLDDKALVSLFSVLRDHVDGVKQLQDVLKRDALDLAVMRRLGSDTEAGDTIMG